MTFEGFGEGAVEFYDGLLADNSKAYWTDQRAVYESDVREPMLALLAALEPEFGGPGKVFRPYRDVRFSADKTPYKTHCGGYTPPYYVQLSADGLMVAAGYYRMESDQVARYRTAVDDERRGADLIARLDAGRAAGLEVGGQTLTRAPRGVAPDHPRIDLLRHKSLHLWRTFPPDDVLHEPACLDRVADVWRAARPLAEWLADHVGPSDRPRR
ncbi:DUF2461 domain-containing protein [Pseudonocardia benzenivorans]|jgi:uncharacterized protein (TIGR02453 family)|uniref:TIGR02453 family protein n=3 Tax=Pseudonocardia TaxID=1847 RepID=F4CMW9_PSEUX|nr:DUF2461 domain-containing protein [Pseudonocardia dioxanivorans]AEA25068.1 Conserved hypothetical protein CHP02453 [Pseudonocardia dioxanivorans CB1190]